jgi:elongation factor G
MRVYDDKHIKNVALVGAHHSGKTTIAETMLFEAGLINRRGTPEQKNTVSDYHEIEHEREASVFATCLHTEWRNYKINIIDTPGLDDFMGEIAATMRVADTIAMVINAKSGVEVGTEIIWNYINRFNRPTLFVINQIDHESANFEDSFNSVVNHFGKNAVLIQYPHVVDGAQCIIDVLKMKMYKFGPEGGKPEKLEIPEDQKDRADQLHNELVEKAAENDEELMELFFDKGTLNEDEMRQGLRIGMLQHEIFPVFCVSGLKDMGTGRLMGFIDNVAPAAADLKPEQSVEGEDIKCTPEEPTSLFIFRTLYEPNFGRITFFKVKSGEVNTGDKLINSRNEEEEVLNQLYIMDGNKRNPINKLTSGDIGATLKLKNTETNDTLHTAGKKVTIKPIKFPTPRISKAMEAVNKRDEEKLNEAIRKLHDQDPTIEVRFDPEVKQTILSCQGELHLQVIDWTLKNEYGMEANFKKPRISYRETIQRPATSVYKHKKQTGGAGQFAEVHMKIEPWHEGIDEPEGFSLRNKEVVELDWGGKLVFYNCVVGGAIDARYMSAIMKGILEVMEHGPITGSPARDIRVMVYDGKMHSVDSNDLAFKLASIHAFKDAFMNASPKLLEPVNELEVKVPEELMGDTFTDLQSRRSSIMGVESIGKYQRIKARTPQAELYGYSTALRSFTQGKGTFSAKFADFSPVPQNIQEELLAAAEASSNGH